MIRDANGSIDPRAVLDETKRNQILSLVAHGASRRVAARIVGCAPSTITRTGDRDPEFGTQLAHAAAGAEVEAIRCIRTALKEPKYWRAAAWLLERKNPRDFGLRPLATFTGQQLAELLLDINRVLWEDLPEEYCQRALKKLQAVQAELQAADDPYASFDMASPTPPDLSVNKPFAGDDLAPAPAPG